MPRRTYEINPANGVDFRPGTANDTEVMRDRMPWWHREFSNAGRSSGLVDWTSAGPVRGELHMHTGTLRTMVGNDHTRGLQDPDAPYTRSVRVDRPGGGWRILQNQGKGIHTNPAIGITYTNARFQSPNPLMQVGRVNRLSRGQFAGQSYSQTTQEQGG